MNDDERVRAAVALLDSLEGCGEELHSQADDVLLILAPGEVRDAYERVVERADFWACG